jgi:membrane protein YdbS with pleckstrin-like domain
LRGPIDRIFKVAKVVVTTAGGDVTLRFLDEEKADFIAENLGKRINQIVVEKREQDGE